MNERLQDPAKQMLSETRKQPLRRTLLSLACISALILSTVAPAAVSGEAGKSSLVYVRAGRLFDSERAIMLPARDIIIQDGLIVKVGERLERPATARLVDLSAYTVLPGLIDSHAHLLGQHPGTETTGQQGVREIVREGEPLRALRGAARAWSYLEAGFTTVRDLGNAGMFADVALKKAIAEGSLPGPRLYVSGPGLAPPGGQLEGVSPRHQNLISEEYRIIRGPDDARSAVREAAAQGVDHIKLFSDASPNPNFLSAAEMRAAVEEAHLLGIPVTAHASSDLSINRALDAGVDSIEHGRGATAATLDRMRRSGKTLIPTEWSAQVIDLDVARTPSELRPPRSRIDAITAASRARIASAVKAGVPVAFGSDLYVDLGIARGNAVRRALSVLVEGGMRPAQALQAATYSAGRMISPGKLGIVQAGAYGDLLAVLGDPSAELEALERVACVIVGGIPKSGPAPACN